MFTYLLSLLQLSFIKTLNAPIDSNALAIA